MARMYSRIGRAWADWNEEGEGKPRKHDKRVSFDHEKLISYDTCVARYHTSVDGRKYVLASCHTYSRSTASHMSNCLEHGAAPTIYVPNIFEPGGWALESVNLSITEKHADNLTHLWLVIQSVCDKAIKHYNHERFPFEALTWQQNLRSTYHVAVNYLTLTGYNGKLPRSIDYLVHRTQTERDTKWADFNSPGAIASRARAKARRIAKEALGIEDAA